MRKYRSYSYIVNVFQYLRPPWWVAALLFLPLAATAHNISGANARFVEGLDGLAVIPYMYLGAKHMVTGYDHLLYLVGVVFFSVST